MKLPEKFGSPSGGAALAVKCLHSLTRLGFGKILKNGLIEFYYPSGSSDDLRNQLIIEEVLRLTNVKKKQVELIIGKSDKLIVTINGFDPEELNKILARATIS